MVTNRPRHISTFSATQVVLREGKHVADLEDDEADEADEDTVSTTAMPPTQPDDKSRGRARVYEPNRTRRALIDASIDLFGSQGFESTSVREIVTAAGLTKGAFYHHFDGKEHVLSQVHEEFVEFQLDAQTQILQRFESAQEQLRHLIRLLVHVVAEYKPNVAIFLNTHHALTRSDFADLFAKRRIVRDTYTRVVADGVASGEFRADLDPRLASLGILGMCNWMYQWWDPDGDLTPEEVAVQFERLGLRAVSANPDSVERLVAAPLPNPDPVRDRVRP